MDNLELTSKNPIQVSFESDLGRRFSRRRIGGDEDVRAFGHKPAMQ
jgi:hypothetical protein